MFCHNFIRKTTRTQIKNLHTSVVHIHVFFRLIEVKGGLPRGTDGTLTRGDTGLNVVGGLGKY